MDDGDRCPVLESCKKLKPEFNNFNKIPITSDNFSLGRGLKNSVVVPFISISRTHCKFKKGKNNEWTLEDNSTFGIKINGATLGKGLEKKLCDGDIISLELTDEFVYKFMNSPSEESLEVPRKRLKMDNNDQNNKIIDDVKMKFEESQTFELKHIEEKIQNAKQMQNTSMILKEQLQTDMNRKILQLENEFAAQIENLKGEKKEVERLKTILLEERDAQLADVKLVMEEKISELMEQIQKHNETESELLKENNLLKEKLTKERDEFLSELNRENTSKQEMLEKLEAKIREQEEVQLCERREFADLLQRETERLRIAKEKELKEIEEQRILRETELKQELDNIKKNLEDKVHQTEQEKLKAEQLLNEQMEHMKKLSNEEKIKVDQLMSEREEIQKKLNEAQTNAEKSLEELRMRVTERETELAALAAERIQKQAEQSSVVINTLQEQLERTPLVEEIEAPVDAGIAPTDPVSYPSTSTPISQPSPTPDPIYLEPQPMDEEWLDEEFELPPSTSTQPEFPPSTETQSLSPPSSQTQPTLPLSTEVQPTEQQPPITSRGYDQRSTVPARRTRSQRQIHRDARTPRWAYEIESRRVAAEERHATAMETLVNLIRDIRNDVNSYINR